MTLLTIQLVFLLISGDFFDPLEAFLVKEHAMLLRRVHGFSVLGMRLVVIAAEALDQPHLRTRIGILDKPVTSRGQLVCRHGRMVHLYLPGLICNVLAALAQNRLALVARELPFLIILLKVTDCRFDISEHILPPLATFNRNGTILIFLNGSRYFVDSHSQALYRGALVGSTPPIPIFGRMKYHLLDLILDRDVGTADLQVALLNHLVVNCFVV